MEPARSHRAENVMALGSFKLAGPFNITNMQGKNISMPPLLLALPSRRLRARSLHSVCTHTHVREPDNQPLWVQNTEYFHCTKRESVGPVYFSASPSWTSRSAGLLGLAGWRAGRGSGANTFKRNPSIPCSMHALHAVSDLRIQPWDPYRERDCFDCF